MTGPAHKSVDLFEHSERLPERVRTAVAQLSDSLEQGDRCSYQFLNDTLQSFQRMGYFFDFGLDAVPYDLREDVPAQQKILQREEMELEVIRLCDTDDLKEVMDQIAELEDEELKDMAERMEHRGSSGPAPGC